MKNTKEKKKRTKKKDHIEEERSSGLKVWYPIWYPQKRAKVITPYDCEDKVMFIFIGLFTIVFIPSIILFLVDVYVGGGLLGLLGFFVGLGGLVTIGYFIGKFIWERV